jgi:putative addiction module killer protein
MAEQFARRASQSFDCDAFAATGKRHAGDTAPVGGGISELRIHYGPGYRIYFQQRGEVLILLLCGGDKITQSRDIRTAKQIAAQWPDNNED